MTSEYRQATLPGRSLPYDPSWVVVPTHVIPGLAPGHGPRTGFPEIVGAAIDNVDSERRQEPS